MVSVVEAEGIPHPIAGVTSDRQEASEFVYGLGGILEDEHFVVSRPLSLGLS